MPAGYPHDSKASISLLWICVRCKAMLAPSSHYIFIEVFFPLPPLTESTTSAAGGVAYSLLIIHFQLGFCSVSRARHALCFFNSVYQSFLFSLYPHFLLFFFYLRFSLIHLFVRLFIRCSILFLLFCFLLWFYFCGFFPEFCLYLFIHLFLFSLSLFARHWFIHLLCFLFINSRFRSYLLSFFP